MFDLNKLATNPISKTQPTGNDARYLPQYELVTAEIAKLSAVQGLEVSWQVIADNAAWILEHEAKDLTLAVYLSLALAELSGLSGFRDGLTIISQLLNTFGDNLHPVRPRARINAINFWQDRSLMFLERQHPSIELELYETLNTAFASFDAEVSAFLPDCQPMFKHKDKISRLTIQPPAEPILEPTTTQSTPTTEPTSATEPTPTAQMIPVTSTIHSNNSSGSPSQQLTLSQPQDLETAQEQFLLAANNLNKLAFLNSCLPTHLYYQTLCLQLWGKVKKLPVAENRTTQIPPPDETRIAAIQALLAGQKYPEAALAALQLVPQSPFCFDLIHLACQALQAQGAEYTTATSCLQSGLTTLTLALPEIIHYKFNDDTPFANQECQQWLNNLNSHAEQQTDPTLEIIKKSNEIIVKKDLQTGLDVLRLAKLQTDSGEIILKLCQAELNILLANKKYRLAAIIADKLHEDLSNYNLISFNLNLALTLLKTIFKAYKMSDDQKAQTIAIKIAQIAPGEALDLL